jgi:autotransporter translocation and assembly factor TamB
MLRWLQRLVWGKFWVILGVLALVLSTLVHVRLPITRRLVQESLNSWVSQEIRGQLAIGEITELTLAGLRARHVWLFDGEGRPIIRAESVWLTPDLEGLWDGRFRIQSARLQGAVVTLYDLGDGNPSLFTTFDAAKPSPSTGPALIVTVDGIELDDVTLQGEMLGVAGMRIDGVSARGRMVVGEALDIRIDSARGDLAAPYPVHAVLSNVAGTISTRPQEGVRLAARVSRGTERVDLNLVYAAPKLDAPSELDLGLRARPVTPATLAAVGLDFMTPVTTPLDGELHLTGPPSSLRLHGDLGGAGGRVILDGLLDDTEGYSVSLQTDALRLDTTVEDGPELTVKGRAEIAKRPDELDPRLHVTLEPMQLQKLAIPAFELRGTLGEAGLLVSELDVKRGHGSLRGSGAVRKDGSLDLRVRARVPAVERDPDLKDLLPGLHGQLEADVRVVTPLVGKRKLDFRGRIVLHNVRYMAVSARRLVLTGTARGDPELPALALAVRGEGVRVEQYALGDAALDVKGGPSKYTVEGQFNTAGQRTFFFASTVDASKQGLSIDADPIELGLGDMSWRGAMTGLSIVYGDRIELGQLRLANRSQRLEVSGHWHERQDDVVEAVLQDFDLAVIRALFGPRFPLQEGRADAQLSLTGELTAPQVTLQGALRGGKIPDGRSLDALYFVTYAQGALELDSELDLSGRGVLRARGNARIDPRARDLSELLESALYSLELEAAAVDLPFLFADAAGAPRGKLSGKLNVQGALSDPHAEGDLSVSRLQLPGVDALEVDSRIVIDPAQAEAELVIADAAGSLGRFTIGMQPDWVQVSAQPDTALDTILGGRWSVSGTLAGRRLDELPRPLTTDLPLALGGQFELQHDGTLAAYARIEGKWAEALAAKDCAANVRPEVRALLTLRDDVLRYSLYVQAGEFRVATADGSLATPAEAWLRDRSFTQAVSQLNLQADLEVPSVAQLPWLCELGDGPLTGTVQLASMLTDHPQLSTSLKGELMPRAEMVGRRRRRQRVQSCTGQPILFEIDARANHKDLTGDVRVSGCAGGQARLTANVPVRWDASGGVPAYAAERSLSVLGDFDNAQLSPILNRVPGIAGANMPISGKLTMSGPLADLRYGGRLRVHDGTFRLVPTGQTLTGVGALLTLDGRRGLLQQIVAVDRRGKLNAAGRIEFEGLSPSSLDLDLSADHFPYKIESVHKADLTGTAGLALRVEPERLKVDVRLDTMRVDLPQTTGRTVQELEPNPDVRFTTDELEEAAAPYVVDLTIDGRRPITVHRNDLDAQVALELQLHYADPELLMSGYVDLRGGNFEVLGKRFQVDHGALRFDASNPGDPDLSLVATHRSETQDNYSVTLSIRGRLSEPEVAFTSLECPDQGSALTLLVSGVCPDGGSQDADEGDREGALAAAGVALGAISGTLGPSLSVEAQGSATRVAAGYNATVPEALRAVVRRVYVQGGVTGASTDASGASVQQGQTANSAEFDVLVKLYFPASIVGTGTVGQSHWGLDLTWEP